MLRSKKQTVNMVQILDSREVVPQERGNVRLIDCETNSNRELEMTPEVLKRYEDALKSFQAEMKEFALRNEAAFYAFDNKIPLLEAIGKILR